jgi:RNA polymerase sigma-70 factor (ECF subfamily)
MVPAAPTEFADALRAARRGDDAAWRVLYLGHASPVLGYLRAQRAPSPEDLLGEVWLQAVRDLQRFEGDETGFRAWLLTIAHHRLLDARRASSRRPSEVSADSPGGDPVNEHEAAPGAQLEAEQELGRLLDGLPERQRSVLYLRYVLDLPQHDVARIMGVSTPAMKMIQARATKALERRVRELDREDRALPSTSDGRSGD